MHFQRSEGIDRLRNICIRFFKLVIKSENLSRNIGDTAFGLLYRAVQLFDLALTPEKTEFTLLNASAGHTAAGIQNIALKSGNTERRVSALIDCDTDINITNYYDTAQQVFNNAAVGRGVTDEIRCNPIAAVHVDKRTLLARKQTWLHCVYGKKGSSAVIVFSEIFDYEFRILLIWDNNILKSSAECHFNSIHIFRRNGNELRYDSVYAGFEPCIALGIVKQPADA